MPEFQRQKRRSLTDEQLYEEYHRTDEQKKKVKSGSPAKKTAAAGKSPPANRSQPKKKEEQPEKRKAEPKKTPLQQQSAPPQQKQKKSAAQQKKSAPAKKKPPAKQPPPRKKRGNMTLYYVLIGVVVAATVSILSVTVLFNISSFQVVGDTSYSDEEIIAACGIETGDNLLRINIGSAEEQIVSKLVYIDSAKISRGFPNRLVISVEPAHPAVSFARGSRYYVISERGRLLEIDQVSADCPVVKGFAPDRNAVIGSQLEDDEEGRIDIALNMIDYMQQYGLDDYCEINLADTLNIRLTYDGRIEMELGANTRLEDKIYHAGLLLKDEISASERCVLILSNPDRVVKRPVYENDDDDDNISEPPEEAPPEEEPPEEEPGNTDNPDSSEKPDE